MNIYSFFKKNLSISKHIFFSIQLIALQIFSNIFNKSFFVRSSSRYSFRFFTCPSLYLNSILVSFVIISMGKVREYHYSSSFQYLHYQSCHSYPHHISARYLYLYHFFKHQKPLSQILQKRSL